MTSSAPLVRCGGCGEPPAPGTTLRRGRCTRCYETWVRARPVGVGAACAGCGDLRLAHLRHFEIQLATNVPGGRWVVLCHNCVADAERLHPPARSIEGLRMRLARDRRWGDRRSESVGRPSVRAAANERRDGDRRRSLRDVFDATDLAYEDLDELIIELEADYEALSEREVSDIVGDLDEVTGIHARIPLD
jgi:hypothetical protein